MALWATGAHKESQRCIPRKVESEATLGSVVTEEECVARPLREPTTSGSQADSNRIPVTTSFGCIGSEPDSSKPRHAFPRSRLPRRRVGVKFFRQRIAVFQVQIPQEPHDPGIGGGESMQSGNVQRPRPRP